MTAQEIIDHIKLIAEVNTGDPDIDLYTIGFKVICREYPLGEPEGVPYYPKINLRKTKWNDKTKTVIMQIDGRFDC